MPDIPNQDLDESNDAGERPDTDASEPPTDATESAAPSSGSSKLLISIAAVVVIGIVTVVFMFGGGESNDPADLRALTPAESHARMIRSLRQIADRIATENPYLGIAMAEEHQSTLDSLEPTASPVRRCEVEFGLGNAYARLGKLELAIDHLTSAYRLLPAANLDPGVANYVKFKLGVAWLRLGETENCCVLDRPESCIVPIQPGGIHTKTQGSTKAIELFEGLLRAPAKGHDVQSGAVNASRSIDTVLASRWLLNLAYMTIGGYPDDVPKDFLIPVETFQSKVEFPRFKNVAKAVGLNTFNLCGGAILDDFDNDGYLDVVTSTWDPTGQLRYFHNDRNGKFTDQTEAAGLSGLFGGLNLNQADFDNDGNLDFLVLRGAWLGVAGRIPNSLVHNNGDGTFTDVTFRSGLGDVHYPTQTAAWFDYDNDGDLDVFIGNEYANDMQAPCQLFRNNGDSTFTDVAAEAGVQNLGYTKGVTWGDVDGDGFSELYVSNYMGANRLYVNNRNGTFTDVATPLGLTEPIASFPTWFWDFDNDGALDLFVASYTGRVDKLASHYLGSESVDFESPGMYRNLGNRTFANVAKEQGLAFPMLPMGSNFGDIDGDGFLDFYLGTGDPDYHTLVPNVMFLNKGGKGFVDVTMAGGFGHLQKGHGIAFGDIDHDGDHDVFAQMGGAYSGDKFGDALFENPGFGTKWISIHLVGKRSNRSAIGARIRVDIVEDGKTRSIYRHVNSGGSFGANPLRQTIGLGKAESIKTLEIYWPVTGLAQRFTGIDMNQLLVITEDETQAISLAVERLKLGG
jgi:hypothetical protein